MLSMREQYQGARAASVDDMQVPLHCAAMHEKTTLDLTDKVALITGASRGIGAETALRFGLAGARVAVNYNRGRNEAEELARTIGDGRAVAVGADIADPKAVETMIDAVVARWGRLDILVNNAAVYELNEFERDDYD